MLAAVIEGEAGSGNEIDDGARHEYFTRCGGFADAVGEVNRDAGELVAAPLYFAGMDADADVEADLTGDITDR